MLRLQKKSIYMLLLVKRKKVNMKRVFPDHFLKDLFARVNRSTIHLSVPSSRKKKIKIIYIYLNKTYFLVLWLKIIRVTIKLLQLHYRKYNLLATFISNSTFLCIFTSDIWPSMKFRIRLGKIYSLPDI